MFPILIWWEILYVNKKEKFLTIFMRFKILLAFKLINKYFEFSMKMVYQGPSAAGPRPSVQEPIGKRSERTFFCASNQSNLTQPRPIRASLGLHVPIRTSSSECENIKTPCPPPPPAQNVFSLMEILFFSVPLKVFSKQHQSYFLSYIQSKDNCQILSLWQILFSANSNQNFITSDVLYTQSYLFFYI